MMNAHSRRKVMKKNDETKTTITLLFSDATIRHSFKVHLKNTSKIRKTILSSLKHIDNLPDYVGEYGKKHPLIIKLGENSTSKDAISGIQYSLNRNGSLRFLDWEKSLYYDWTYGEIKELQSAGIIDGNINHIVVEFPMGLGAAGGSGLNWDINDFLSFVESILTIVKISLSVIKMIKVRNSIKTARKNGFESPEDIRAVIQRKDVWTLQKIRALFKADDIFAAACLIGLGYVNKGKYWKYDNKNPESLKARAKWIEDEKKKFEEMQNQG